MVYIISDIKKSLGLEWVIKDLIKHYSLKLILINCDNSSVENLAIRQNIPYKKISYKNKYKDFLPAIFKIIFIFLSWKPKVIHCHLRKASILGLTSGYFLRIKKRIYTRHHGSESISNFFEMMLDKLIFYISTDIISISDVTTNLTILNSKKNKKKITKIPHGFDLKYFRNFNYLKIKNIKKKYNLNKNAFVIGVVSRLIEWKNIEVIIDSFKLFKSKYKNAILVIANAEINSEYAKYIQRKLNSIGRKNFRLIIFENDIKHLYKSFDLFLHIPKKENLEAFGQIYVESMLLRVPSIYSNAGILTEYSNHLKNAFICNPNNKNQIFHAMEYFKKNENKKKFIIKNAYTCVKEKFSLQSHLEKLYTVYNS